MAAAQALVASGARVVLWDDNAANCAALPVGLGSSVVHYDDWDWAALDALLLSPGIPLTHPKPHAVVGLAREHGVRITSDIELLCEAQPAAKTIAITGTNGKSTTTALIGHILQTAGRAVQVGGNIGTPALAMEPLTGHPERSEGSREVAEDSSPAAQNDGVYVLELSSFQLDLLTQTRFNIAIWLNISPDHLDRHGDMDGYIAAKKQIFAQQTADDLAIVGVDDAYSEAVCRELIAGKSQRVVPVSLTQQCAEGATVRAGILHVQGETLDLNAFDALRGAHNHQNAAAAYAVCAAVGLSHADIAHGMASFGGLAHRMQKLGEKDGVSFVNDSKATNADAAAKSLSSFESIYWIAGGVPKAGGIDALGAYFPRIKKVYLIGEAQAAFAQTLDGHVKAQPCESLAAATRAAYEDAKAQGGVVLLAPACASFDQFPNFEKRGDAFEAAVREIINI